eukprot:1462605-Amphidinium_carterae.1
MQGDLTQLCLRALLRGTVLLPEVTCIHVTYIAVGRCKLGSTVRAAAAWDRSPNTGRSGGKTANSREIGKA